MSSTHVRMQSQAAEAKALKSTNAKQSAQQLSTYPPYLLVPGIQKNGVTELVKGTVCKDIMLYHSQDASVERIATQISMDHLTNIIEGERPYTIPDVKAIIETCKRRGLASNTPLEANWENEVIDNWWIEENRRPYEAIDKRITGMDVIGWWSGRENPSFAWHRWRDTDIGEAGYWLRSMPPN